VTSRCCASHFITVGYVVALDCLLAGLCVHFHEVFERTRNNILDFRDNLDQAPGIFKTGLTLQNKALLVANR